MLEIQKKLSNSFYAILSLPSTGMGFALSIQIAALSWILNSKYNLDIEKVGFVWAAGPLAGIIGQPIIGLISDKVWFWGGRRRPFILIGGTIAALMLLALPNIDSISSFTGITSIITIATIIALTLDLAINISFNPTRSIIADVTPEGIPRTKGYTWMQTISGFFGVTAYLIGAIFNNYVLIYSGAVLVLLFSIIPILFITETKIVTVDEIPDSISNLKDESKGTQLGQLFRIYFAHAYTWLGVQTMFVYIIAYIQQKLNPASQDQTGQIISISFAILNTIGFILPAFVLEPIAEKIGRVKTHLCCVAIMSLGYFGIVLFGHSVFSLYIIMAVLGIGWAAVVSLPFAIMTEKVAKAKMGFYMGIFNLSVVLPQLIASLVLGRVIKDAIDKNIIFLISGISLAISAVLWLLVKESAKSKTEEKSFSSSGGH